MSEEINIEYFPTPYGELILGSYSNMLCLADWRYRKMRNAIDKRICSGLGAVYKESASEVLEATKAQLTEYLNKERTKFDIPLLLIGSKFQKSVWEALTEIPYGITSSYLQLSNKLNNTKAIRAVAAANGANAISFIVPCHRVIGSDGDLVGYAGGLKVKEKILQLEGALVKNQLELFE